MNIFYKPGIGDQDLILDPKESAHCIKVLRYKVGDSIKIIDGVGGYYEGEISNEDPKACEVKIVNSQRNFEALPYELHIGIAPTKSMDRFEWFVEKATEIGVSSITPLLCTRSERRHLRIERIEKVMIAAAKQSVKARFPQINELTPLEDFLEMKDLGLGYIAHCMDGDKQDTWKIEYTEKSRIVIGPEGDFTSNEVLQAEKLGFKAISLGNYRLRTETAGVVACSSVYFNMQA